MVKTPALIWGLFLIAIGIILIISNTSAGGIQTLWPIFPFSTGLVFLIIHTRKNLKLDLLLPGVILVIVSILLFYCNYTSWRYMEGLWPVFFLAPGIGFGLKYFTESKQRNHLNAALLLTGLAGLFWLAQLGFGDYWPIFLIVAGTVLVAVQLAQMMGTSKKTSESD